MSVTSGHFSFLWPPALWLYVCYFHISKEKLLYEHFICLECEIYQIFRWIVSSQENFCVKRIQKRTFNRQCSSNYPWFTSQFSFTGSYPFCLWHSQVYILELWFAAFPQSYRFYRSGMVNGSSSTGIYSLICTWVTVCICARAKSRLHSLFARRYADLLD